MEIQKNTVICEITSIVFSETFDRPNGIIVRNNPIIIHPKSYVALYVKMHNAYRTPPKIVKVNGQITTL